MQELKEQTRQRERKQEGNECKQCQRCRVLLSRETRTVERGGDRARNGPFSNIRSQPNIITYNISFFFAHGYVKDMGNRLQVYMHSYITHTKMLWGLYIPLILQRSIQIDLASSHFCCLYHSLYTSLSLLSFLTYLP